MCRSEAESGVMCDGSPRKTLRTADVTEEETEDHKGPAPGSSRSKNQPSPASTPAGCQQDSQAHTLPGAGVSLNTQGQACAHGGGGARMSSLGWAPQARPETRAAIATWAVLQEGPVTAPLTAAGHRE